VRVLSVRFVGALVFGVGLAPLMGSSAFAEDSCMVEPAKLSDAAISTFNNNPSALKEHHPSGGPAMSAEVRRLTASDIGTAPKLIDLAKNAKPEHIVALGIGLAQAAAICTKTKPELAKTIKKLVAESGIPSLVAAFATESSLFAFAPDDRSLNSCTIAMGEPTDMTATPTGDEERVTPSNTGELSIADELGIGQPGFLYPFTFGAAETQSTRRRLPQTFGGGGLIATTGNVVSPTRPPASF
jgi:hypothetical protein